MKTNEFKARGYVHHNFMLIMFSTPGDGCCDTRNM
jgi:hypothetical protein